MAKDDKSHVTPPDSVGPSLTPGWTEAPETLGVAGACAPSGVYVHFPWCVRKCPYCDFLSLAIAREEIPHLAYLERVSEELERRTQEVELGPVQSIFVGGGTPSLWDPRALGHLIERIVARLKVTPDLEVTVECNPSSFDRERARVYRHSGVTRVSLGVQSLDPGRLEFLGRWHSPADALRALDAALGSGIPRVSADLIYGLHGQSAEAAAEEASRLAGTGITHLSAYTLTIEKGTQFGARARKGTLPLLSDDTVADSFLEVHTALAARGFEHYEISNFARQGHYARHNLGYWRGYDYLGLGAGAWGTVEVAGRKLRYRNTPSPERYLETRLGFGSLQSDYEGGLVQSLEPIDAHTALSERLLLGLRLAEGLDLDAVGQELGIDPWTRERAASVERLLRQGRLERHGGTLSIPFERWLLADGTIAALL